MCGRYVLSQAERLAKLYGNRITAVDFWETVTGEREAPRD